LAGNLATHKDIYRVRAMEMISMRIQGQTVAQIATHFNCHKDTVLRSLAYAEREGLVRQYENDIVQNLVPEASQVYMAKLLEGNEYVAKDVIDKVFKLGERFAVKEAKQEEQTLAAYLDEVRLKTVDGQVVRGNTPESPEGAHENTPTKYLPEGGDSEDS
jgi:hypothetical protein